MNVFLAALFVPNRNGILKLSSLSFSWKEFTSSFVLTGFCEVTV
ncbi:MAG: hypothetical protein HW407_1627 [Bacteroidetes bacterium]|nr:hypothetical protein [Bacteroidota bacterium]